MRGLKITKKIEPLPKDLVLEKLCKDLRELPKSASQEERLTCAERIFERRTGVKEGAKVRYIGVDEKYCGILDLETIYEIEYIVIGRSYNIVKLVGFREEEFHAGMFEAINKDEETKCLKIGDRVRYIASKNYGHNYSSDPRGVLDFETIYEVECIERDLCFIGHKNIKLVGFEGKFNRILFEKVDNHQAGADL